MKKMPDRQKKLLGVVRATESVSIRNPPGRVVLKIRSSSSSTGTAAAFEATPCRSMRLRYAATVAAAAVHGESHRNLYHPLQARDRGRWERFSVPRGRPCRPLAKWHAIDVVRPRATLDCGRDQSPSPSPSRPSGRSNTGSQTSSHRISSAISTWSGASYSTAARMMLSGSIGLASRSVKSAWKNVFVGTPRRTSGSPSGQTASGTPWALRRQSRVPQIQQPARLSSGSRPRWCRNTIILAARLRQRTRSPRPLNKRGSRRRSLHVGRSKGSRMRWKNTADETWWRTAPSCRRHPACLRRQ